MKNTMISLLMSAVTCASMVNGTTLAAQKDTNKKELVNIIDSAFKTNLSELKYESTSKGVMTFSTDQYEVEVNQEKDTYNFALYSISMNEALEKVGVARTPLKTVTYTVEKEEPVKEEKQEVVEEEKKEEVSLAQQILEAAKAQLGVNQDCTMLVTNSLAAVGINFHGAPEQYECLGEWTNNPVPGDIIIYSGHVAIYAGDGMAVHGGFYGYTTQMYTVECTNPLIGYIHVTK